MEYRLKLVHEKLKVDVPATVSDDQEEGGVSLAPCSGTDYGGNVGRSRKPAKSENYISGHVNGDKFVKNSASARQETELERQLEEARQHCHIAEVDVNYCCFAPRDQPYICLFPTDERGRFLTDSGKGHKNDGKAKARLDPEQELQKDAEAGILRTNLGSKPPLWIGIEEKMKAGLFKGLTETLRLDIDQHDLTHVGGKVNTLERAMGGISLKRRHSWMDDDETALGDSATETQSDSGSEGDSDEADDGWS